MPKHNRDVLGTGIVHRVSAVTQELTQAFAPGLLEMAKKLNPDNWPEPKSDISFERSKNALWNKLNQELSPVFKKHQEQRQNGIGPSFKEMLSSFYTPDQIARAPELKQYISQEGNEKTLNRDFLAKVESARDRLARNSMDEAATRQLSSSIAPSKHKEALDFFKRESESQPNIGYKEAAQKTDKIYPGFKSLYEIAANKLRRSLRNEGPRNISDLIESSLNDPGMRGRMASSVINNSEEGVDFPKNPDPAANPHWDFHQKEKILREKHPELLPLWRQAQKESFDDKSKNFNKTFEELVSKDPAFQGPELAANPLYRNELLGQQFPRSSFDKSMLSRISKGPGSDYIDPYLINPKLRESLLKNDQQRLQVRNKYVSEGGDQTDFDRLMWDTAYKGSIPFEAKHQLEALIPPNHRDRIYDPSFLDNPKLNDMTNVELGNLLENPTNPLSNAQALYHLMSRDNVKDNPDNIIPEKLGSLPQAMNPLIYPGERLAELSPETLKAREQDGLIHDELKNLGDFKHDNLAELANVYGADSKEYKAVKTKYELERGDANLLPSAYGSIKSASDPLLDQAGSSTYYQRMMDNARKEAALDREDLEKHFKEKLLPSIRSQYTRHGAYNTPMRAASDEKLLSEFSTNLTKSQQARMLKAEVAALAAEREGHEMKRIRNLDADKQRNEMHKQLREHADFSVGLTQKRSEADRNKIKTEQEAQAINLGRLKEQRDTLARMGHEKEARSQAQINADILKHAEGVNVPVEYATRVNAINKDLPVVHASSQAYGMPMPQAPAPIAQAVGVMQSLGTLYNDPYHQQQQNQNQNPQTPYSKPYKTGGQIKREHSERTRKEYEDYLKKVEAASENYKNAPRGWNPADRALTDSAASWMRAGSGEISAGEASARGLESLGRHREAASTADLQREKDYLNLADHLAGRKGDLYGKVEAQEHHDMDHELNLSREASRRDESLRDFDQRERLSEREMNSKAQQKTELENQKVVTDGRDKIRMLLEAKALASSLSAQSSLLPDSDRMKNFGARLGSALTWGPNMHDRVELFDKGTKTLALHANKLYGASTIPAQKQVASAKADPLLSPVANRATFRLTADVADGELRGIIDDMRRRGISEEEIKSILDEEKKAANHTRSQLDADAAGLAKIEKGSQEYKDFIKHSDQLWGGNEEGRNRSNFNVKGPQAEGHDPSDPPIPSHSRDSLLGSNPTLSGYENQSGAARNFRQDEGQFIQSRDRFVGDLTREDAVSQSLQGPQTYERSSGQLPMVDPETGLEMPTQMRTSDQQRDVQDTYNPEPIDEHDPYRYAKRAAAWGGTALGLVPFGGALGKLGTKMMAKSIANNPEAKAYLGKGVQWLGDKVLGGEAYHAARSGSFKPLASVGATATSGGLASQGLRDVGSPEYVSDIVGGLVGPAALSGLLAAGQKASRGVAPNAAEFFNTAPAEKHLKRALGESLPHEDIAKYEEALKNYKAPDIEGYHPTLPEMVESTGKIDIPSITRERSVNSTRIRQRNEDNLTRLQDELVGSQQGQEHGTDLYHHLNEAHLTDKEKVSNAVDALRPDQSERLATHEVGGVLEKDIAALDKNIRKKRAAKTEEFYEKTFNPGSPEVTPTEFHKIVYEQLSQPHAPDVRRSITQWAEGLGLGDTRQWKKVVKDWDDLTRAERMKALNGLKVAPVSATDAESVRRGIAKEAHLLDNRTDSARKTVLNKMNESLQKDITDVIGDAEKVKKLYAQESQPLNEIFGTKELTSALSKNRHGKFDKSRGSLPHQFLRGDGAVEASQQLLKSVGPDAASVKAISNLAVEDLFESALTKDKTINLKAFDRWEEKNPGFEYLDPARYKKLKELAQTQGELSGKLGRTEKDWGASDAFTQKGGITRALKESNKPEEVIDSILSRLPEEVRGQGRKGITNEVIGHMRSVLTKDGYKKMTIHGYQEYMRNNKDTLRKVLDDASYAKLEEIEKAIKGKDFASKAGGINQSITSPAETFKKKYIETDLEDKIKGKLARWALGKIPVLKDIYEPGFGKTTEALREEIFDKFITDKAFASKIFSDLGKNKNFYKMPDKLIDIPNKKTRLAQAHVQYGADRLRDNKKG